MRPKNSNGRCNVKPIKKYMKKYGLSQAAYAERIGKTQTTVCQWLTGIMPVSPASAKDIEMESRGEVKRTDILPELFA